MNEFGVVTEARTVRIERLLPAPIETVWAYLTEPTKRGTWLAGGPLELSVGGSVELHFNFDLLSTEPVPERFKKLEQGHIQRGHVTQCDAPRLLGFTWDEKPDRTASEVTFELIARGAETQLIITHRQLPNRGEMISVGSGWHVHLDILEDRLYNRDPRPFWSTHAILEKEYERRIEKK